MEALNRVIQIADRNLSVLYTNPYVSSVVTLFLLMYAGLAAPALPASIAALFDQWWFKVSILFIVLAVRNYNPTIAILVAVGFMVSMQTLSKYHIFSMASEFATMGSKSKNDSHKGTYHHNPNTVGHPSNPQPESQVNAHPPSFHAETTTQVAAKLHPNNDSYQGPQGLQGPHGYMGPDLAPIGSPGAEL